MSVVQTPLITDICLILKATPTGQGAGPWTEIAHLVDGTTLGITVMPAAEVSQDDIDALDAAGQEIHLGRGLLVTIPELDEEQLAALALKTTTTLDVMSFQQVQDHAKKRAKTTALGTDVSKGLTGALTEIRRRLLNLTATNVLISLRDTKTTLHLDESDPFLVLEALVEERYALGVCSKNDPIASGRGKQTEQCLRSSLVRKALNIRLRAIEQEYRDRLESRGLNEFYLALGTLAWQDREDSQKVREAPLVLVPLTITRERIMIWEDIPEDDPEFTVPGCQREVSAYQYTIETEDGSPRGNPTLALKLAHEFDLALPELAPFDLEDGDGLDLAGYFKAIASSLKRHPESAAWAVRPKVILGFFSYTKAVMEADLNLANWPQGIPGMELLESTLLGSDTKSNPEISEDEIEAAQANPRVVTIDDCDSSQARAILRVDQGHDVVIQGPPGTGKSQTITNLIAHAIASGKRVLFLSEKMAALNVVRDKLKRRGLENFLLPLHDTKLKTKELHHALRQRLHHQANRGSTYVQDVAATARVGAHLSSWAKIMRQELAGPGGTPGALLWQTSDLRRRMAALRQEPGRDLGTIMADCLLPRAPDAAAVQAASDAFDELAIHEQTGLLDRCACWSGFLVVPLDPIAAHEVERALDRACLTLTHLDTCLAPLQERGWMVPEQGWKDLHHQATVIAAHRGPGVSVTPAADRILKSYGPLGDLGTQVGRWLDLMAQERNLVATIRGQLGSLPEDAWCDLVAPALAAGHADAFAPDLPLTTGYELAVFLRREVPLIATRHQEAQAIAQRLGLSDLRKPSAWENLAVILEAVQASPANVAQALASPMAEPAFVPTMKRIIETILALRKEREGWNNLIEWEDLPDNATLATLRQDLRAGHGSWTTWWPWSRYAKAKQTCRRFMTTPNGWPRQFQALLKALSDIPTHRKSVTALAEDPEAKAVLGALFSGMSTDLATLQNLRDLIVLISQRCAYSELRTVLGQLGELARDRVELVRVATVCRDGAKRMQEATTRTLAAAPSRTALLNESTVEAVIGIFTEVVKTGAAADPFLRRQDLPAGITWHASLQVARQRLLLRTVEEQINAERSALALAPERSRDEVLGREILAWLTVIEDLPKPVSLWIYAQERSVDQSLATVINEWKTIEVAFSELCSGPWALFAGKSRAQGSAWPRSGLAFPGLVQTISTCRSQTADLMGWSRIVAITTQVAGQPAIERLVTAILNRESSITVAESRCIWMWAWLEAEAGTLLAGQPDLRGFDRARHESRRQEFAKLDRALKDSAVAHAVDGLLRVSPNQGNARGKVSDKTEMALIEHFMAHPQARLTTRDLLQRSGRALQSLMPCWMMSPLSVSWFLPRDGFHFDLVVMDEASQIRPEDAMGALMRARQAVIVGDTMQMPPSRAFDSSNALEGLFAASTMESVLALAEGCSRYRKARLTWHYRSRHQSLIAFSNAQYYDSQLLIFPSVHRHQTSEGINLVYLSKARYQNQQNQVEAETVVKRIVAHAQENLRCPEAKRQSLGVAAMNAVQRDLILDLLETRCARDAVVRKAIDALNELPEPLFVQNLENIQGDERDHIIISFTYGPDAASGVLMQRFGPILQAGGERRLNVLFTRARIRITAVTSMKSSQIKLATGSSRGLRDLQAYLAYAETGNLPQEASISARSGTHDSNFEQEVASVLTQLGLSWDSQVGVAGYFVDLGIYHPDQPGKFLLGIECDGATYHSSRVARDRDRLREEVIRSRGWDIYRIWSTDWFHNRSLEVERLKRYLSR